MSVQPGRTEIGKSVPEGRLHPRHLGGRDRADAPLAVLVDHDGDERFIHLVTVERQPVGQLDGATAL